MLENTMLLDAKKNVQKSLASAQSDLCIRYSFSAKLTAKIARPVPVAGYAGLSLT